MGGGAVGNPAGVGFLTLLCAQHEGHVRQCHSLPGSGREKRKGVQLSPPQPDFRHCTQLKERELRSASGWPLSLHHSSIRSFWLRRHPAGRRGGTGRPPLTMTGFRLCWPHTYLTSWLENGQGMLWQNTWGSANIRGSAKPSCPCPMRPYFLSFCQKCIQPTQPWLCP